MFSQSIWNINLWLGSRNVLELSREWNKPLLYFSFKVCEKEIGFYIFYS